MLSWHDVLRRQIMSYEDAEDEYFRARAGDLKDVETRVRRALGGIEDRPAPLLPGAVVVDDDLTPSAFLSLDWSVLGGVALERGSPSAHVAMLARARGVPMATNLGEVPEAARPCSTPRKACSWSGPTRRPVSASCAGSTNAARRTLKPRRFWSARR